MTVKEGEEFLLKCGVTVTCTKYVDMHNITVIDCVGNTKIATATSLRSGTCRWLWGAGGTNKNWTFDSLPKDHYVYIASSKGVVYYVGMGTMGRYTHAINGRSTNELLNRHYYLEDDKLEVEIYRDGMTKRQALDLEGELIIKLKPAYNKIRSTVFDTNFELATEHDWQ